ncbi:hypothetical protein QBC34DRAFT_304316 [Podospora aff. communis PSN243]|uniref:Prolyl 4-hydroxylase alpha subunit domain-containing protein n=1 Tax=Podospora aff. communis PSN243 TaxID=3040156 RepID=A0AAV9GD36_9PEZI|nr:hypothetical protein QBC34DRAFT_304316 [Podospora aff. communis PSN243]
MSLDLDSEINRPVSDGEEEDLAISRPDYTALYVPIPDSFLTQDPPDARPVTAKVIDWTKTVLPENEGRYAVVLDHVMSPSECETLLRLAEDSVADRGKSGKRTWRPALVNVGGGLEMLDKEYRNSDRIIWDNQVIMDRLWDRCARAEGIEEKLAVVKEEMKARRGFPARVITWNFSRFNERMRFLKYQGGQFFRPHCDGAYSEEKDGKIYRTHYTVHLYLNDSAIEAEAGTDGSPSADLVGGATSFLSNNGERKVDVNPKAGRVLIFQHQGLYHSGDDVVKGTKYTMRTDIMYELVRDSDSS